MPTSTANPTPLRLESTFGTGRSWTSQAGSTATAWELPAYHLLWAGDATAEGEVRRLWEARKGRQAYPVVLLAPSDDEAKVQVAGPQDARPVRELPAGRVLDLLETSRRMVAREAASFLAREFSRLEEAVVPGLRVKDLLTPHFLRERMRWPVNQGRLSDAAEGRGRIGSMAWRSLFQEMGYQVEQLPHRGYLLRYDNAPVAVVHPHRDPANFSRLTDNGELPEGMVLADCGQYGAQWGVLAASGRYRLFQRRPPVGPATGQHLEIDTAELERKDRFYLGLLAPESLKENGWLTEWVAEAKDFGEELRRGLEERLIKDALPNIARGLGEYLESQGADLSDGEQLRQIEEAALTLVFRFMFLLHTEARGYLPIGSAAYRPHSARQLAEDSRLAGSSLSRKATQRWDRLRTLVRMVRTGDRSAGVPAYNGSLFAADGFPGSALLERAEIADIYLAPALVSIAYETDKADAPGLDYAGLQIGHLGAIYEALLTLRLTRAPEDLAYDARGDVFRPVHAGEQPEVTKAQLYYQAEAGGRKAGGVFYTRHEFVDHLLNHSLLPALDDHLAEVRKSADRNPSEAAQRLFDFSVVDPAMGSAHFLTAALDMMADRIEIFLAEVGGLPGIAQQLSELSHDDGAVSQQPEDGDLLRRLILKRCIYGVDLSPMAVEVANVTLWLASFVPGLALSYLGSNLKCGDALIGVADPSVVGAAGSTMVQRLDTQPVRDAMNRAAQAQREIAAIPDRTPDEVKRSEELSAQLRQTTVGLRAAFDLWASEPLGLTGARRILESYSDRIVGQSAYGRGELADNVDQATDVAAQYRFFHWPLEFPNVFHRERPGFDVVVGNPPWEEVTVEELAFYALHDTGLRGIKDLSEQRARIVELDRQYPNLRNQIDTLASELEARRNFFSPMGGYLIQGVGDPDLYKLFCERYSYLARVGGYVGVVLPSGVFVNYGSVDFRKWLFEDNTVLRLDTIRNTRHWAFPIHAQFSIALVAARREAATTNFVLRTTGPSTSLREFTHCSRDSGVSVPASVLSSRWEIPSLQSDDHAQLLEKLRAGVLFSGLVPSGNKKNSKGAGHSSRLILVSEIHETNDRRLFRHSSGTPVWKARSFHPYDPHGDDPAGFADWDEVLEWLNGRRKRSRTLKKFFTPRELDDPSTHPVNHARIAYHDVTNSVDYDTVVAGLVPPKTPLTNTAPYIAFDGFDAMNQAGVLGVLNSLPFDWQARRYVKLHLSFYILNMLTFPPQDNTPWQRIGELAARLSCVDERFAGFAAEAGVEWGILTDAQCNGMRAEIDALVAHAYGLTEDELRFIFTDFTENAITPAYRRLVLEKFEGL
ncbi:MAG: hypothetical protein OXR67_03345 [Chloroflexota bacterium]|nr:hypothetical protein [Chloroflexota bacterium]